MTVQCKAVDITWQKTCLGKRRWVLLFPDKEKKRQHESKTNLPNRRQLIIGATLLASLLSHAGGIL